MSRSDQRQENVWTYYYPKRAAMKRISFVLVAVATLASVIAYMVPAFGQADEKSAPVYLTKTPSGYRDWMLIAVAHEEGNLHSFAAVLGNEVAIKAYREGKPPFPDGAIIAALHYSHVPSEENNKVFGQQQSFVPGPPTNIRPDPASRIQSAARSSRAGQRRPWRLGSVGEARL